MIILEIDSNENCAELPMRVFHEAGETRAVSHVRIEQKPGIPEWFKVAGWSLENEPETAFAQKIDDSPSGTIRQGLE